MKHILVFFAFALTIGLSTSFTCSATSYALVDRTFCITSCNIQNCATGYCVGPVGDGTCECSRCSEGSNINFKVNANLGRRKKRDSENVLVRRDYDDTLLTLRDTKHFDVCLTAEGELSNNTIVIGVKTVSNSALGDGIDFYHIRNMYLFFHDGNQESCFTVVLNQDSENSGERKNFTLIFDAPTRGDNENQLFTIEHKQMHVVIDNTNSGSGVARIAAKVFLIGLAVLVGIMMTI